MNGTVSRMSVVCVVGAALAFWWACLHNAAGLPHVQVHQWHHLYLGLALVPWGIAQRRPWVLVLAALLAVDDGWQHVRQVTGDPTYVSPLHQFFAVYLWPLPPVRWLVMRLDALFA